MSKPPWTELLVDKAREGDDDAYEALFGRVRERLRVYVQLRLGRLRTRLEADDVIQETYVTAHRSFDQFRAEHPGSFRSWLYRIADSRLRDLYDHHSAQKRSAPGGELPDPQLALVAEGQAGPATESAAREQLQQLRRAIESALDEREQEVLMLRHFHELTYDQIAAAAGLGVKQVRTLLARSQFKLSRALEP